MTTNTAAVRVLDIAGQDQSARIEVAFPRFLAVHIPAIDETRYYDLDTVPESALIAALEHGLSQRLTDSAAGESDKTKALAKVEKREGSLWAEGRTATRTDPVTAEMFKIVCDILRRPKSEGGRGLKTKELPTMKEFPGFLAEQDQAAVAKIRQIAEANVEAAAKSKAGLTL